MTWYTSNPLFPHEVHEGLINPFDETRPEREEQQDEGFGGPELDMEEIGGEA